MPIIIDEYSSSFFSDNSSFVSVPLSNSSSETQRPSQIIEEYKKNGPRKSDPYNTDDSTDADTDYNENDIAVTSLRKPSLIKESLRSFRKRIRELPKNIKPTFTGKRKSRFFCCFRQNT